MQNATNSPADRLIATLNKGLLYNCRNRSVIRLDANSGLWALMQGDGSVQAGYFEKMENEPRPVEADIFAEIARGEIKNFGEFVVIATTSKNGFVYTPREDYFTLEKVEEIIRG